MLIICILRSRHNLRAISLAAGVMCFGILTFAFELSVFTVSCVSYFFVASVIVSRYGSGTVLFWYYVEVGYEKGTSHRIRLCLYFAWSSRPPRRLLSFVIFCTTFVYIYFHSPFHMARRTRLGQKALMTVQTHSVTWTLPNLIQFPFRLVGFLFFSFSFSFDLAALLTSPKLPMAKQLVLR